MARNKSAKSTTKATTATPTSTTTTTVTNIRTREPKAITVNSKAAQSKI